MAVKKLRLATEPSLIFGVGSLNNWYPLPRISTAFWVPTNQGFINLCLNSELSSIITLQPIERFNLDSAIIFSDILMVPYALNQKVEFLKNHGPKLENFDLEIFLKNDDLKFTEKLKPVYKAIEITRKKLNKA